MRVHPDLVISEQRRRRSAGDPLNIVVHTFEIERAGAFNVCSVYQAHAQGRGADYSWVAFHDIGKLGGRDRIYATAKELGIGLIGFTNPNNLSTWKTVDARKRTPTTTERDQFADCVMPQPSEAAASSPV